VAWVLPSLWCCGVLLSLEIRFTSPLRSPCRFFPECCVFLLSCLFFLHLRPYRRFGALGGASHLPPPSLVPALLLLVSPRFQGFPSAFASAAIYVSAAPTSAQRAASWGIFFAWPLEANKICLGPDRGHLRLASCVSLLNIAGFPGGL